jgi:hypothetical protein
MVAFLFRRAERLQIAQPFFGVGDDLGCCGVIQIIPFNPMIPAEPGKLPFGVTPGLSFYQGSGFIQCEPILQIKGYLFVPDCLKCGRLVGVLLQQRFHFGDQT